MRVARATGDIPQNINFAIKSEIAAAFLRSNGVEPRYAVAPVRVATTSDIAENARLFTVLIECDPDKRRREEIARIAREQLAREAEARRQEQDAQAAQAVREAEARRQEQDAQAARETELRRVAAAAAELRAEREKFLRLSLPVRCELGTQCVLPNLMRHDGDRDFMCGARTTSISVATSFRLLGDWRKAGGLDVVAAADGVVSSFNDREVVLDHGGGWVTAYSRIVPRAGLSAGTSVRRGEAVGMFAAWTETNKELRYFHFYLKRDGSYVDPFTDAPSGRCGEASRSRWTVEAQTMLTTELKNLITDFRFTPRDLEVGKEMSEDVPELKKVTPPPAFLRLSGSGPGVLAGDAHLFTLVGPNGHVEEKKLVAAKDFFSYSFRMRFTLPVFGKNTGRYTATVRLMRAGVVLSQRETSIDVE